VLGIAVGVFAWLAVQSRNEAGLGRTANSPPAAMRHIPLEQLALLARFEPPEYDAADNADDSREFRAAMEHYRHSDYAGAVAGLRAVVQAHPDSVEARFYLAICLLLTNDRPGGIQLLKDVTASGNTPYLESARFYLAKALLSEGNLAGADLQLRIIIEMHGKLENQAQVLHAQIIPQP
jgi:predicted Zn-dependent protease